MANKDVTVTVYITDVTMENIADITEKVEDAVKEYETARTTVNFRDTRNVQPAR